MTNEEALAFLEKQQSKMTTYRQFHGRSDMGKRARNIGA